MYKALQNETSANNMDVKEKWELEANVVITDDEWEETFRLGHRLTNSPTWKEFDWWKCDTLTLLLLPQNMIKHLIYAGGIVGRWGTLLTHFGTAERLKTFGKVYKRRRSGYWVTPRPKTVHIRDTAWRSDTRLQDSRLQIPGKSFAFARKVITALWMKSEPPNITHWRDRVKRVFIMEKTTARLQLKLETFNARWESITQIIMEP